MPLRKDALLLLLLVQLWPLHFVPRLIEDQSTSRNITSFLPPLLSLSLALTAAAAAEGPSLARSLSLPSFPQTAGGLHLLARPSFDSGGAAPGTVESESGRKVDRGDGGGGGGGRLAGSKEGRGRAEEGTAGRGARPDAALAAQVIRERGCAADAGSLLLLARRKVGSRKFRRVVARTHVFPCRGTATD